MAAVAAVGGMLRRGTFFSVGCQTAFFMALGRLYRTPLAAPVGAPMGRLCHQRRPIQYISSKTSQDFR